MSYGNSRIDDCDYVMVVYHNQGQPRPYWAVDLVLDPEVDGKGADPVFAEGIPTAYRFEFDIGDAEGDRKAYFEAVEYAKKLQRLLDLLEQQAVDEYHRQRS